MPTLFAANGYFEPGAFTPRCWDALQEAREVARRGGWDSLRTPHAFIGVLLRSDPVIARWGEFSGLDLLKLAQQMEFLFRVENSLPRPGCCPLHREFCSNGFLKLLHEAGENAKSNSRTQIAQIDIAAGVLADCESVVSLSLTGAGLSCRDLATLLAAAEQAEISGCDLV